ncbi:APC family permease [Ligilactobacillus ceti]|uniref:Amino acid transporter n=1 Tax=Ligilactobacillus ceti DSM 22408 TaxID=1122146 RepID=A0A0R2KM84_9LACO|nr:APC family permease [Ligilactobacillus ceti]KRN90544.1 amino acid transporter [Ligilactobacillus ceti DSM 22408]
MAEQKVSVWKSILFTICSILVLDTFVAPAIIGVSSITLWIITAIVFFLPYGLVSAELGSNYPDDGGIYSWVKQAYGEKTAVMVGWYYWVNVAFWMPAVFIAFSYWISYTFMPDASPWVLCGLAVAMCWLIVYIGIRGVDLSVTVSNIAAICKVAVLLIFGFLGIAYAIKFGANNDFSLHAFIPSFDNTTQYISAIAYNLLGFELIGSIGSQIEDPEKTIPKMTVFAGVIITALYVFGTFGVLVALPADKIDSADGFFYALQELCSVFGPTLSRPIFVIVIVVAALTLVSNMVSWALGANEVLSASELDKRSKWLGHKNKKYGTPDGLYIIMGLISTFLLVLNFSLSKDANQIFWVILSFSFVVFMLPYLFMFPAAITLRKKNKDMKYVYKVPGGEWGLKLCVFLCEICVLASIFFLFKDSGGGIGLWTLIIGTAITTFFGWLLIRAGEKADV